MRVGKAVLENEESCRQGGSYAHVYFISVGYLALLPLVLSWRMPDVFLLLISIYRLPN